MTDRSDTLDLPDGWAVEDEEMQTDGIAEWRGLSAVYRHRQTDVYVLVAPGAGPDGPGHHIEASVGHPAGAPQSREELEWRVEMGKAKAVGIAFMHRYSGYREAFAECGYSTTPTRVFDAVIERHDEWGTL